MRVGLIGVGVVGGVLLKWFQNNTTHEIKCYDPGKGMTDSLEGCEAIFISVPVPSAGMGQDLKILREAVAHAKKFVDEKIFIRSTVLPGTNDEMGTIAMPEFLTERTAYEDFCKHTILMGKAHKNIRCDGIFPDKEIVFMSNKEAELAKFTHNCFGALKVTYFNVIAHLCDKLKCDFDNVKAGAMLTKYIEATHTQVPGPDGQYGYGGKCFPENMDAFTRYLFFQANDSLSEHHFFKEAMNLNRKYRKKYDL